MKIIMEETQVDASAWTAVVEVAGVLFRAGYVASKLSVGLVPYKSKPRRPRWALTSVQAWAEQRVRALPPAWMEAHCKLYGEATP